MKIKTEKRYLALFIAVVMILTNLAQFNVFAATKPTLVENIINKVKEKPKTTIIENGTESNFQIVFTSDLHGTFSNWNYATDKESTGLARIATQLKTLINGDGSKSRENTILIDIGDTIQGNGTGNFIGKDFFPIVKGFEYLNYDAEVTGNHEFNFGVPNFIKAFNGFTGKLLCANIVKIGDEDKPIADPNNPSSLNPDRHLLPDTTTSSFSPYMIKQMPNNGPRVAVIGITTPNIIRWDTKNLEDAGYTSQRGDVILAETIKFLKDNNLADVFVAAAHMSQGDEYDQLGSGVKSVLAYGNNKNDLDLILGAHGHTLTGAASNQCVIDGVKYAENAGAASSVGVASIKATFIDGKWQVVDKLKDVNTDVIRVPITVPADPEYMAAVAAEDAIGVAYSREVVGTLTGGPLVPSPAIKNTYEGYLQDTALIDLINNVMMHYTGAELAGTAPLDTNANLQPGQITRGGVAQIYKYDNNTLYKLSMTGKQFKQWMEWSYQYFGKSKVKDVFDNGPAVDLSTDLSIPYGNGNRAGYNQDSFDGLLYDVDLTKPVGERIVNIRNLDGSKFDFDKTYIVACNNYRATTQLLVNSTNGVFKPGEPVAELIQADVRADIGNGGDMMSLVADYIANVKGGVITNDCNNNWKFINLNWDANLRKIAELASYDNKISVRDGYFINAIQKADVQSLLDNSTYKYVNILGFNDFHGQMDEAKNADGTIAATGTPGAAKLTGAILEEVNKYPQGTMVLSAGDSYQGSAISNLNNGKPVSDMFKVMGVKYSAIGNHEFDWTLDLFGKWAKDGDMTFLSANIYDKRTGEVVDFAKPYAIENINGVKVGIIGLITTETPTLVKAANIENFEFKDPSIVAKSLVDDLKDNQGCDIVIALTHLGARQDAKGITGEAADLANNVPRLDGIISGHTHSTVNGVVNGVPIVQAYYNGRSYDKLSFVFDSNNKIVSKAQDVKALYTPAAVKAAIPVNADVKAMVDKYNNALGPILGEVVGFSHEELSTKKKVADWADELLYDYLLRTTGEPTIVIQNDGGWRAAGVPLKAGDITMRYMYDLMPFDNEIVIMDMKGSDLKAILDRPDSSYGSALDIWGMSRTEPYINLSDGKPLDLNATYKVMCNDFMFTGGDKFDFTAGTNAKYLGIPLRNAMVEELKLRMTPIVKEKFALKSSIEENGVSVHFKNNTDKSVASRIIVAVYNEKGMMVNYAEKTVSVDANGEFNHNFIIDKAKYEGYTFKVFAWDAFTSIPLCNASIGEFEKIAPVILDEAI